MFVDQERFGERAGALLEQNIEALRQSAIRAVRPPPRLKISEWAEQHRRFPDEDAYPGPWRNETAPELVEIMDALVPEDPCEEVVLIKCAQSGGSASGENAIGYWADLHPGPGLFVQATQGAAKNWAREKFWPMARSSPRLDPERGGAIRAQDRDGTGSTTTLIRFASDNGYLILCGANSAADLRQRTVRYAIEDDLDQFPDVLDNQGSPESMVSARLKVFRSRGLSKRLKISTPTIKGVSKIGAAYEASDARRFYFKCCHCGDRFDPVWEDIIWDEGKPETAHMVAPCCGGVIEDWRKRELKLSDGWLSRVIDGERSPRFMGEEQFQELRAQMPLSIRRGFHLEGMISTFQSWVDMAVSFVAAQGDENALKTWTNLTRGVEFELKGGRPDFDRLKVLREQDWGRSEVPAGVVAVTLGADVQADGIYLELVGWGQNWESWQLDARFLPGATDVSGEGAWKELDAYSLKGVTFPGGRVVPIDQECVDAGYHTDAARAYCAARKNRLAVFGRAGWDMAILGRGEAIRYDQRGKRAGKAGVAQEDRAFLVGTYPAKLTWYGFLRESIVWHREREDGDAPDLKPKGLVHVGRDVPEDWFDQVTAEVIVEEKRGLGKRRVWKVSPGRQNHYLDCRIYNRAAAEKLRLDMLSNEDWERQRDHRHEPVTQQTKRSSTTKPKASWIDGGKDYL